MTTPIRWGILGTGAIAHLFATGLAAAPSAQLLAVGSRTQARAEAFGNQFGVPRRYASYAALASDPDVDVIYISTPHPFHHPDTLFCLTAGKAVLCEKPFALNVAQAEAMVALARSRGLFLMEAMWTRFLPALVRLRELLAEGAIGEVTHVEADFGFRAKFDPQSRLLNPDLGGGALLDVGIYPISLASMIFGPPTRVIGSAMIGTTGVDEVSAALLGYNGERSAMALQAVRAATPQVATITGTQGTIVLHRPWWRATRLTLAVHGRPVQRMLLPLIGNGYNYEAIEVMRCLRAGRTESETMPLDETLSLMRTLDMLRAQWGLRYSGEANT